MPDSDDVDARFRDLVQTEFGTSVPDRPVPEPAPRPVPAPPPTYQPRDTFDLNLFDDDEDYRRPGGDRVQGWAMVAVALLFVAVLAAALMIAGVDLPGWARWLGLGGLVGGIGVSLWQFRGRGDDDDGAVV